MAGSLVSLFPVDEVVIFELLKYASDTGSFALVVRKITQYSKYFQSSLGRRTAHFNW